VEATSIKTIVIIGTGRAAQFFAQRLLGQGYRLLGFCGSGSERGKEVAIRFQVPYFDSPQALPSADLIIVAVPDSKIEEVSSQIPAQDNTIIVHCSGATALSVLSKHKQRGVIYPLQSLHSLTEETPIVPLLIEANCDEQLSSIQAFAQEISSVVTVCDSNLRLHYHLSAVFLNNFVTHLHILALDYLKEKDLNPTLVQPLIAHTFSSLMQTTDWHQLQTGPALRKDHITLALHAELLKDHPILLTVYQQLSDAIAKKNP
jgi:predicted short-subunit dehydrogenase-like oxidoreductase (DUF2520 family)